MDFHPFREWIHGDEEIAISICHLVEKVPPCRCSIRRKVRHLCPSNVALLWAARAVCPIGRWHNAGRNQPRPCACLPPIRTAKGAQKLVLPAMPKGIMCVRQQLCTGQERGYVHPSLRRAGRRRE